MSEIKEYYSQFLKQVRRHALDFWWAQIAVGLIVGVATAVTSGHTGVMPKGLVLPSIEAIFAGSLAAFGVGVLLSIVLAPVTLHRQGSDKIASLQKDIKKIQQNLLNSQEVIDELRQQLDRKTPHDEHLEGVVRDALSRLDETEGRFVDWLLQVGRADNGQIYSAGFGGTVGNSVMAKTNALLIQYEAYKPGNGTVEMGRTYFINPTTVQALENVLYNNKTE